MKSLLQAISRAFLALFFLAAGANHFINPDYYLGVMPPYVPFHQAAVVVSGLAEMALGILLVVPRARLAARWGLLLLLLAIFPSNIHMAFHAEAYPFVTPAVLWGRLPLQFLFMAWIWWCTPPRETGR